MTLLGVGGSGRGAVLIVAAAASYALGALLTRRWFPGEPSVTVTAAMLLIAAPPLLVVAVVTGPTPHVDVRVAAAVLVLAVGCTAGGFTAFFALIAEAGPTTASFITYLAPLAAISAGVLFRGESITFRTVVGAALVLSAAAMAARPVTATRTCTCASSDGCGTDTDPGAG